jgi:hypothetical protein
MKSVDRREFERVFGLSLTDDALRSLLRTGMERGGYAILAHPVLVAKSLMWAAEGSEFFGWELGDWGVWPSVEVPGLYQRLRRGEGITASLRDKPCDIFTAEEQELALCLLSVAVCQIWDVMLVTAGGRRIIHCSHDEYLMVLRSDDEFRTKLEHHWEVLGCRRLAPEYFRQLSPHVFGIDE